MFVRIKLGITTRCVDIKCDIPVNVPINAHTAIILPFRAKHTKIILSVNIRTKQGPKQAFLFVVSVLIKPSNPILILIT